MGTLTEKTKDTKVILKYKGVKIGHAIVREYEDGEKFLADFMLDSNYRDHGLGQRFLLRMIKDYGINSLTVGIDNARARHIYDKFGFKVVLGPYYDKNSQENVYYMKRSTNSAPNKDIQKDGEEEK